MQVSNSHNGQVSLSGFLLICFSEGICSPGCPGIHYLDQTGLKLPPEC